MSVCVCVCVCVCEQGASEQRQLQASDDLQSLRVTCRLCVPSHLLSAGHSEWRTFCQMPQAVGHELQQNPPQHGFEATALLLVIVCNLGCVRSRTTVFGCLAALGLLGMLRTELPEVYMQSVCFKETDHPLITHTLLLCNRMIFLWLPASSSADLPTCFVASGGAAGVSA